MDTLSLLFYTFAFVLVYAGFRVITFDQVKADYRRQVRSLIAGGVGYAAGSAAVALGMTVVSTINRSIDPYQGMVTGNW